MNLVHIELVVSTAFLTCQTDFTKSQHMIGHYRLKIVEFDTNIKVEYLVFVKSCFLEYFRLFNCKLLEIFINPNKNL